jgi:hypothetical protein
MDKSLPEQENQAGENLPQRPQSNAESTPDPRVQAAMRKVVDRDPGAFVEFNTMMGSMAGHPLHHKMDGQHITKVLELASEHEKNEFTLKSKQQDIEAERGKWDHVQHLIFFVIFVGLIIFILWEFKSQPAVLVPILSGVGGTVAGFMAGLGYARSKRPELTNKSE